MRVVWSVLYFFSVVSLAGPVLVKEQKKGSNPLMVPYQQYRLDNGLTVILTQDHSDPLVYVEMNYRVGLAEEAPGQSGMAHLFEHMMFQGSAHVGKLGHTRLLQQVGGRGINGLTTLGSDPLLPDGAGQPVGKSALAGVGSDGLSAR